MLIFVYGTLMSGLGNHGLIEPFKFKARGKTKNKYAMYARGIPYVSKEEELYPIDGEIWDIPATAVQRVDLLEGHPDWYKREEITVINEDGEEKACWMYFCDPPGNTELIKTGNYRNYINEIRTHSVQTPLT